MRAQRAFVDGGPVNGGEQFEVVGSFEATDESKDVPGPGRSAGELHDGVVESVIRDECAWFGDAW